MRRVRYVPEALVATMRAMKYLIALALLWGSQAFAQTSYTCQRVDSLTVNCESNSSHMDTTYVNPNAGAAASQGFAQGIANAQAMANGPLQMQLLQQQIEQQRLQNELLKQQIEAQRHAIAAQSAQQDHQIRLERLQRSIVTTAACLNEHTTQECSSDPDVQAAREDVASGRISNSEFLQAAKQADKIVKASH
jgi:hypothetical protein